MTTADKHAQIAAIERELGIRIPVCGISYAPDSDADDSVGALERRERELAERSDTVGWELESSVWKGHTIAS